MLSPLKSIIVIPLTFLFNFFHSRLDIWVWTHILSSVHPSICPSVHQALYKQENWSIHPFLITLLFILLYSSTFAPSVHTPLLSLNFTNVYHLLCCSHRFYTFSVIRLASYISPPPLRLASHHQFKPLDIVHYITYSCHQTYHLCLHPSRVRLPNSKRMNKSRFFFFSPTSFHVLVTDQNQHSNISFITCMSSPSSKTSLVVSFLATEYILIRPHRICREPHLSI